MAASPARQARSSARATAAATAYLGLPRPRRRAGSAGTCAPIPLGRRRWPPGSPLSRAAASLAVPPSPSTACSTSCQAREYEPPTAASPLLMIMLLSPTRACSSHLQGRQRGPQGDGAPSQMARMRPLLCLRPCLLPATVRAASALLPLHPWAPLLRLLPPPSTPRCPTLLRVRSPPPALGFLTLWLSTDLLTAKAASVAARWQRARAAQAALHAAAMRPSPRRASRKALSQVVELQRKRRPAGGPLLPVPLTCLPLPRSLTAEPKLGRHSTV